VQGYATNGGIGVYGFSNTGSGVFGWSGSGPGAWARSDSGPGLEVLSGNTSQNLINGYGADLRLKFAVKNSGRVWTSAVEIYGGGDLAEKFEVNDAHSAEPGTVMVIDEANPGKLKLSTAAYDSKVAGIVSGAGGVNPALTLHQEGVLEGSAVVAITGRVYVKAEALSGPIQPGDLLTTSSLPGHAMKAANRERSHGAILGKAMTGLPAGKGLVLVLVNLQ
jgi:hypothetical protein